jgi:uncharacterized protein (UPF0147 family)|tara:strand:+ start:7700 stop:8188 length:489 start_codon:yes stop_codon:yes gene_type:complete
MNTGAEKDQETLDKALHNVEFVGLSKDEKKQISAYNTIIQKGLAVFNGKELLPTAKIAGDDVTVAVEELIVEDKKELLKQFKDGFRQILKDKISLDNVILTKQKEFNKAVVAEKKTFTVKANKVLSIIGDIEQLKNSYMAALSVPNVTEEINNESTDNDTEE